MTTQKAESKNNMTREKYKLLKELASLTLVTETLGFIGLIINAIGKDLNLQETSKLGLRTWAITLTLSLLAFVTLLIEYYWKQKKNLNKERQKIHGKNAFQQDKSKDLPN